MITRRPNPLAIMREAHARGEGVRIIYTHGGDMIIEPCPLTDAAARACVPTHDQAATQDNSPNIVSLDDQIARLRAAQARATKSA